MNGDITYRFRRIGRLPKSVAGGACGGRRRGPARLITNHKHNMTTRKLVEFRTEGYSAGMPWFAKQGGCWTIIDPVTSAATAVAAGTARHGVDTLDRDTHSSSG